MIILSLKIKSGPFFIRFFVKFTYLVGMIAGKKIYDICFTFFDPTASATAYGQRPKFFRSEHSATAEGENCTYGPTLQSRHCGHFLIFFIYIIKQNIGLQLLHLRL